MTPAIEGQMSALAAQRDEANNRLVILHGHVSELQAKIKELQAQLEAKPDTNPEEQT